MQHYMPMPPAIVPPGMTTAPPGAPVPEDEPNAKRQKTDEINLIPEDQFLLQNSVCSFCFIIFMVLCFMCGVVCEV